jgi:ribosome maturation factor RimP
MSQEEQITRIEEAIVPVLRSHGLELVDLEWRGHGPRGRLRVFIDKPGGVGIRDCERVSREVGDVLDVADVIAHGYDLEVSSPGLDRWLRTDREYRWAVGKRVRCWLANGAEVTGQLVEAAGDRLVFTVDGERREVLRADLKRARLEPSLRWSRQA